MESSPGGATVLEDGDHLTVIGEPDAIRDVADANGRPATADPTRP